MGDVLVLINSDTSCHGQRICSYVYALVSMYHGKVVCLFIVNGDKKLVRDFENRLVPGGLFQLQMRISFPFLLAK